MAAISGHIPSLRRQIKNVACNYSDAQVKVREATSNDPWGASSSLMSEVADLTYNAMAFTEIMQILWKRLNDHGKNWRHVYKSLVLLDYLMKVGSEKVAHQCRENIFAIQTLKDFQHIEDNKDQGMNVREKAKQLVAILKDDERLKNERSKALMARKRFTQNGAGLGGEGTSGHRRIETCRSDNDLPSYYAAHTLNREFSLNTANRQLAKSSVDVSHKISRRDSELEECRPSSAGEEELQLQIALALSKEEAQKDVEAQKNDEMRLQLALQESQKKGKKLAAGQALNAALAGPGQSTSAKTTCALDDLLSLQQPAASSVLADPWGHAAGSNQPRSIDPWAAAPVSQSGAFDDPFVPSRSSGNPIAVGTDPWSTPTNGTAAFVPQTNSTAQTSGQSAAGDPWGSEVLSPLVIGRQQQQADQPDLFANDTPPHYSTIAVDQNLTNQRKLKTPENFLGENSNLVNLDNLMAGGARSNIVGIPQKSAFAVSTNPFAISGIPPPSCNSASLTNPFAAQQKRATPTLNEMRGASSSNQQPTWGGQSTVDSAPTNPFS